MVMDVRDLYDCMGTKRETYVRKMLIEKKMAKAEELATMTCLDVCKRLLKYYAVISYDSDEVILVKLDDMDTYKSIVTVL